jgi:hypothetical protein
MDSYLADLIRGDGDALRLSGNERRLLEFALKSFGEPLSEFLLAGVGEEIAGRKWCFSITFTAEQSADRSRELSVEAEEHPKRVTHLPRRREPLVLLALLRVLLERGNISSANLSYKAEVLGLLGWEDNDEARLTIDATVMRYAGLTYSWALSDDELLARGLTFYHGTSGMISSHSYEDVEAGGVVSRVANDVTFATSFAEELMRRTLFDVDWDRVRSVTRSVIG